MDQAVRVAGLSEARKALKALSDPKQIDKAFRETGRTVAAKVATKAQTLAALTGRKEVVRAARTIKPASTVTGVAISAGARSGSERWAAAALFGTHPDQTRMGPRGPYIGYRQFVGVQKDGGVLYRAFAAERDTIEDAYMDAIELVFSKSA